MAEYNVITDLGGLRLNTSGTSLNPLTLDGAEQSLEWLTVQAENLEVIQFPVGDRVKYRFDAKHIKVVSFPLIEGDEFVAR